MEFFKPYIIDDYNKPNPYKNSPDYIEQPIKAKQSYKGYLKITYKSKVAHSLPWRFGYACLAILANIIVIPRCIDKKGVKEFWKRAKTGQTTKVVLIDEHLELARIIRGPNPQNPPKSVLKKNNAKNPTQPKGVQFVEDRKRFFDKEEPPQVVAELHSVHKDLREEVKVNNQIIVEKNKVIPELEEQKRGIPPSLL